MPEVDDEVQVVPAVPADPAEPIAPAPVVLPADTDDAGVPVLDHVEQDNYRRAMDGYVPPRDPQGGDR